MKILQGRALNITSPIIGRVTRKRVKLGATNEMIYVSESSSQGLRGYAGMVTAREEQEAAPVRNQSSVLGVSYSDLSYLQENDVVMLEANGQIKVLWDADSPHNGIFVTNGCNCK